MADQPFFRVHKSALQPALNAVFEAVDTRSTIPILENVLLCPKGNELLLRGTDLSVEVEAACELLDEGLQTPVTMSGEGLRQIVRNLPENAEITFSPGAFPDQIKIQSGRSRFTLRSLPEKDFPSIAEKVEGDPFDIEIGPLIDALGRVSYAIKDDETRFYLSGACIHPVGEDGLAVVGCDGHNLAVVRLSVGQALVFRPIIVPLKMVKAARRLFGGSKGRASVTVADAMLRISCAGVTVISKLVDGQFPDYNRIIPSEGNSPVIAPVLTLKAAVSRVCIVANDLEKDTIRLQCESGELRISMKSTDGEEATEDMPVDYDGPPFEIGFNGKYMTHVLGSIGTQDVAIHVTDAGSPGLFRPTIDRDEHFVLMPRRM